MAARKPKGSTGVMTWLRELDAWLAEQDHLPVPRVTIYAMAVQRALHADGRTGANCRPQRSTIAHALDVRPRTVKAVDDYLEDHKWLSHCGTWGRQRTPIYRLTVSPARPTVSRDGESRETYRQRDGRHDGRHDGRSHGTAIPPTSDVGGGGGTRTRDARARDAREVRELLHRVAVIVPGADTSNGDLVDEVAQLARNGWTAEELTEELQRQRLPANVSSPTGLALRRLRQLPGNPVDRLRSCDGERCRDLETDQPLPDARLAVWFDTDDHQAGLCEVCFKIHRGDWPVDQWVNRETGQQWPVPVFAQPTDTAASKREVIM